MSWQSLRTTVVRIHLFSKADDVRVAHPVFSGSTLQKLLQTRACGGYSID
jgi:hypothetical protein